MKFPEIETNDKFGTLGGTFVKLTEFSYAGITFDGRFVYSEVPYYKDVLIIPFGKATLMERDLILHCVSTQTTLSESE